MALTAANPYAFGIGMPQYSPAPDAPIQPGLDLQSLGAPAPNLTASAAGRSLLAAPAVAQTTPPVTTPAKPSSLSALAPALAGLQSGQLGTQAYDVKSGVVSTLGAAASGAAAGALAGSAVPGVGTAIGAAVGGGIGLVTGGLNAWMSVGKENKANRERKKLLAEAKSEQNRRDTIARADAVDELSYERKQIEDAKRLAEWQQNRALLADASAQSKSQADEFISKGYNT